MHAIFIPYGNKSVVEIFLENLNQRLLPMKMTKGDEVKYIYIQCQIRFLPFGFVEFVFPKEYKDEVLTALNFKKQNSYKLDKRILGIKPLELIKKFLRVEKIEYEEKKGFPILDVPISIIPIGIRKDGEIETDGWKHEAI